jgi:hypothetical protein
MRFHATACRRQQNGRTQDDRAAATEPHDAPSLRYPQGDKSHLAALAPIDRATKQLVGYK